MLRLGWFSTGRGPGSRNLLKAIMDRKLSGELDIEISFVFCNWSNEEADNPRREQREMFFDMVRGYGIPLVTASWREFEPELRKTDEAAWRVAYGKVLRESVAPYPFDLGVLAGYMLWMDDETCREFDMLNLHPALPDGPKGTWQEVIWQLISEKADRQGAMMHVCTEEWDRGAAITYCGFPIRGGDYDALWEQMERKLESKTLDEIRKEEGESEPLFRRIREDGAKRELPLIAETVAAFADGRVRMEDKRLIARDGDLDGPYDLSDMVDRALEG
ncbi:MAG: formyltransferase family protein [Thermoplasmata archaeon]|nr:formyltransferase family protein [Thermoplasmata archaeon]